MNVWSKERGYRKLKEGVSLEQYQEKYPSAMKAPSAHTLENWLDNGVAQAIKCHCKVEPDGICCHGNPSWLIAIGVI